LPTEACPLDTIEVLFSSFTDEVVIRAELVRLFRWIKDRGLTAIVTGERGASMLTFGLEEFVADCVIVLDHRIDDQISTRRLVRQSPAPIKKIIGDLANEQRLLAGLVLS
jgi:KaiC/GvpD/RAD55 family RecA-like ATPase